MSERTHVFQPPKGTRDFYPADMALRRHIEQIWREVSINHGFEEIDGPTFEHLDLYTVKSGDEIVSQLFRFQREGGDTEYALRPEFTPTLARMYAARAGSLSNPTKWFCIPNFFRAERPQRGRLREFFQWNVDIIGDPSPRADAEVIATAVGALEKLKLTQSDVRILVSHRSSLQRILAGYGFKQTRMTEAFALIDSIEKIGLTEFRRKAPDFGFADAKWNDFEQLFSLSVDAATTAINYPHPDAPFQPSDWGMHELDALHKELNRLGLLGRCRYVPLLSRGLAYYTGVVFEVREATGKERAIAGGGRYDGLIELYGGPPTPAVGFAMGDVVIRLVLEDKGLLQKPEEYLPRPDVFVISSGDDLAEKEFTPLVALLRREGLHVRHSYRATKNVGKLLGEASKARARFAVILGRELDSGNVIVKDLESGAQNPFSLAEISSSIRTLVEARRAAEGGSDHENRPSA